MTKWWFALALASALPAMTSAQEPLREVLRLDGSKIVDFDGSRALAISTSQPRAWIVTTTGAQLVWDGTFNLTGGNLIDDGAFLRGGGDPARTDDPEYWVWRMGALTPVVSTGKQPKLAAAQGRWLAFEREVLFTLPPSSPPPPPDAVLTDYRVVLTDLASGVEVWQQPQRTIGPVQIFRLAVAPDGDVLWTEYPSYPAGYWRDGVTAQVRELGGFSNHAFDGNNGCLTSGGSRGRWSLHLHTATTSEMLCELSRDSIDRNSCGTCAVGGGWAAWSYGERPDNPQVFQRTPDGARTQVTSLSPGAVVAAQGSNGDLVITSVGEAPRYYLLRRGDEPRPFADYTSDSRVLFHDGWYLLQEPAVFRIFPEPVDGDAGAADAGLRDAAIQGGEDAQVGDAALPPVRVDAGSPDQASGGPIAQVDAGGASAEPGNATAATMDAALTGDAGAVIADGATPSSASDAGAVRDDASQEGCALSASDDARTGLGAILPVLVLLALAVARRGPSSLLPD